MFFVCKEYLRFLIKSTNQHGVHSPFVYDLVTKCFYDNATPSQTKFYKRYKNRLLNSKENITVSDFGIVTKVFKSDIRTVSKTAKITSIKKKHGLLLMRLIPYLEISNILEIGTSLGVSSSCMAFENSYSEIITLECCQNTANVAKEQFDYFNLKNIKLIIGGFEKTLPKTLSKASFDFVFFEGNHTKKATLEYFNNALQVKHNDSVFIFDNIHWSKEMVSTWEEIKQHSDVTVTIDLFQWGIVFFRKEQQKEHFIIRI